MKHRDELFDLEPEGTQAARPVEYLRITFSNNNERREHFLGIFRKKLKDLFILTADANALLKDSIDSPSFILNRRLGVRNVLMICLFCDTL